jgi:hypothetical protein
MQAAFNLVEKHMANVDVYVATPDPVALRRPAVSWLAIVGGWLVGVGIAWLFYTLGLAVGFTAFNVSDAAVVAKGIGVGTVLWVVLTWAVSLFLGGMFASWMDARPNQTVGTLHGIAVWGLTITVTSILGALGFTNLLQGSATLLHGAATVGPETQRYTAWALWTVFFSGLIALVAAAAGGWAGSGHIHRVHSETKFD